MAQYKITFGLSSLDLPNPQTSEEPEVESVLSFDGVDDYADTTISTIDVPFTIEFWVYPNLQGDTVNNYRALGNFNYSNKDIYIGSDSGNWRFTCDVTDPNRITTSSPITDLVWQHIAYTVDSNGSTAYKDGAVIGTAGGTSVQSFSSGKPLTLMFLGDQRDYFPGKMEEFRLWNTARTQTEIQNNMNKELTGNESGLEAYYKLDSGSGTTAVDSTGSNDGTINGATWIEK